MIDMHTMNTMDTMTTRTPTPVIPNHISSLHSLTEQFLRYDEQDLTQDLFHTLDSIAERACQDMREKAGEFLHHLDENIHTEEQVQAVIDACPESLSYINEEGRLPIQSAVERTRRVETTTGSEGGSGSYPSLHRYPHAGIALKFVPLLAREGQKRNVSGKGRRGGLLTNITGFGFNIIQFLAAVHTGNLLAEDPDIHPDDSYHLNREFEIKCLEALMDLKVMGLFVEEDIYDHGLLFFASDPRAQQRFDFLAQWNPQNLKRSKQRGSNVPLIHAAIGMEDIDEGKQSFEIVLKASSRHFPHDLGFFLSQEYKGEIACKAAIERFGQLETMAIICRSIPASLLTLTKDCSRRVFQQKKRRLSNENDTGWEDIPLVYSSDED